MTRHERPAAPKVKPFTHATYIPQRYPEWKFHHNIGHAKNALNYMVRYGEIYELNEDGSVKDEPLYVLDPEKHKSASGYWWQSHPWDNE